MMKPKTDISKEWMATPTSGHSEKRKRCPEHHFPIQFSDQGLHGEIQSSDQELHRETVARK